MVRTPRPPTTPADDQAARFERDLARLVAAASARRAKMGAVEPQGTEVARR